MTFEEMLDQALAMLQRRGRVTSRALTRQLMLDDEGLEALKDELLYAHPQVGGDEGRGLVWRGANVSDLASAAGTVHASASPPQGGARASSGAPGSCRGGGRGLRGA
jgi:hypothetical protein